MFTLRAIVHSLILAAVTTTVSAATGVNRMPEEITITGQQDPVILRRQLDAAELRVFELFNEFNTEDLYDIQCRVEAPLGSRIPRRKCLPRFIKRAEAQQGLAFMALLRSQAGDLAVPVIAEAGRHFPILQRKMLDLIEQEPALFDAAVEYQTLYLELEASMGGRAADTR